MSDHRCVDILSKDNQTMKGRHCLKRRERKEDVIEKNMLFGRRKYLKEENI